MSKGHSTTFTFRLTKEQLARYRKVIPYFMAQLQKNAAALGLFQAPAAPTVAAFIRHAADALAHQLLEAARKVSLDSSKEALLLPLPSVDPSGEDQDPERARKVPTKKKSGPGAPARKFPWPVGFDLTEKRREYAMEKLACTGQEARELWERFQAHHTAAGSFFATWDGAWIKWVLNEKQYAVRGRMRPGEDDTAARLRRVVEKFKRKAQAQLPGM